MEKKTANTSNVKNTTLSESLEDYLETILKLQTIKTVARSKDIAEELNIKRGSVTGMLKKLAANKMINYEPYGYVTLTAKGKKIAEEIEKRHIAIKDFLIRILKVEKKTADDIACHMEHAMDNTTFKRFTDFIKSIDSCPRCGK
ncbi:MAG: metal-dependent transcriptional regulator [Pseudomonadota bacterium]